MNRFPGRVLLIVAAFALLLVPVAAIAAAGFDDVGDDNVFKSDIQWLADADVTKGCNPPTNDKFCPESNVTREQMAAFMHRLAVNKVVDAKTAMDADRLDGKDSTAFATSGHDHDADYLAVDGKAADADKLDGIDPDSLLPDGTPPVGTTARGNYTIRGDSSRATDNLNWGFELPSSPTAHFLPWGAPPTADCPGTSADPQAAEGHLCVYEGGALFVEDQFVFSGGTGAAKADPFGASVIASNTGSGDFHSFGTWAVTVDAS